MQEIVTKRRPSIRHHSLHTISPTSTNDSPTSPSLKTATILEDLDEVLNSQVGILSVSSQGLIRTTNENVLHLLHYNEDELVNKPADIILSEKNLLPELVAGFEGFLKLKMRAGSTIDAKVKVKERDLSGTLIWTIEEVVVSCVLLIVDLGGGYFIKNGNGEILKVFGLRAEDILGKAVVDLVPGFSSAIVYNSILINQLSANHKELGEIPISVQLKVVQNTIALWISINKDILPVFSPIISPSCTSREEFPKSVPAKSAGLGALLCLHQFPASLSENTEPLQMEDFETISRIGEGAFSYINLCFHKKDPLKTSLVVKYVIKTRIISYTRNHQLGLRIPAELAILSDITAIPHPNLPLLGGHFSDDFYYGLILQHNSSIDLFEFIERNQFLEQDVLKSIIAQTFSAVAHLHHNGIVHRDIKDENILINPSDFKITLIDFGSSAFTANAPFSTFFGTELFSPPEVLQGVAYDGKPQDVWALGVLVFILHIRSNPFSNIEEILNYKGLDVSITENLSPSLLELLSNLLSKNVPDRWTIDQAIGAKYLVDDS